MKLSKVIKELQELEGEAVKLSKVIKELQELEKEHGGDIQTNVYLYKEMTPVRYIGVRDVHSLRNGVEFAKPEIFIEGDKYQDL